MMQFDRTLSLVLGDELLGLRVQFNIEKEMTAQGASKADIKIFNLSPTHQAQIESGSKGQQIRLSVGYGGENKVLYQGPVFFASLEKQGADVITTCQMWQGVFTDRKAFVQLENVSDDYEILKACLTALKPYGVARGHVSDMSIQALRNNRHSAGFSGLGPTSKFLTMVTKAAGLRWANHNQEINIFGPDEYELPELIELSATSGMIGVPSKAEDNAYKVRALLNPDLAPGRCVRIKSTVFPMHGDLKIIKGAYVGDSLEGDWYCDLEGVVIRTLPGFVEV